MAESAESTCSTVCTRIEPSPIVVARSTVFTLAIVASIVGSSWRSLRLNLIPELAGAGWILSDTLAPVWSEVPLSEAALASVC